MMQQNDSASCDPKGVGGPSCKDLMGENVDVAICPGWASQRSAVA